MSTLKNNLTYSTQACDYLLKTLGVKGANWDQYRGTASYEQCVKTGGGAACKALKDSVDICLYDQLRPDIQSKRLRLTSSNMLGHLRIIANGVGTKQCANCGEFSAAAFIHLYDKKVRPLDWVSLKGADHAFVIIGRAAGDINDYSSWGPEAAVCDPWARGFRHGDVSSGTYAGTQFSKKMTGLIGPFSGIQILHREE